jgi:hypothetical protein
MIKTSSWVPNGIYSIFVLCYRNAINLVANKITISKFTDEEFPLWNAIPIFMASLHIKIYKKTVVWRWDCPSLCDPVPALQCPDIRIFYYNTVENCMKKYLLTLDSWKVYFLFYDIGLARGSVAGWGTMQQVADSIPDEVIRFFFQLT